MFFRRFVRIVQTVLLLAILNVGIFTVFGDMDFVREKEIQFVMFLKRYDVFFVNEIAQFFHSKSPLLETYPYEGAHTDSRVSTWFAPPHQVVMEWVGYVVLFVYILTAKRLGSIKIGVKRYTHIWRCLFHLCLVTLAAILYFKYRAGWELGQWFNLLYMLQPCHVLLASYTYLAHRPDCVVLREILWDVQWFTWFAIAFPDIVDLNKRGFVGELFLFYFEHFLLAVLPLICLFFSGTREATGIRPAQSVAWAGLYHIQVMTPISLLTGTQLNYQTHLPKFAMHIPIGRAYKAVLLGMYFVLATIFALWIEPVFVVQIRKFRVRK